MELGSLAKATHDCIYIILEGGSAAQPVKCRVGPERAVGINKKRSALLIVGGNLPLDLLIKLCLQPA